MRLLRATLLCAVAAAVGAAALRAEPLLQAPAEDAPHSAVPASPQQTSICLMLEAAARANDLPVEFFARVIWRESRFAPTAIGPLTRSGHRAQGIAQFMPYTADERGLLDPFDPVQALPKAAEFLRELRGQFGNLGLAAAAYNAGPRRVRDWLAGTGPMPAETRAYVLAITGRLVEDWINAKDLVPAAAPAACDRMIALLKQEPNRYVLALEQRIAQAAGRPWGVQLAAGFSRDKALSLYARSMTRLAAVTPDRDPIISSQVFRSRGTRPFYKVSIGAETRTEANTLCAKIHAAGVACIVMRNRLA